jgi:hypothetical protein
LAAGQSAAFSVPRAAGEAPERVALTNAGGHLHVTEPAAAISAQRSRWVPILTKSAVMAARFVEFRHDCPHQESSRQPRSDA